MKLLAYIGFTALIVAVFFGISRFQTYIYPLNVLQNSVHPDNYLMNSKLYIKENLTSRSRSNLSKGIQAIREIKEQADPASQAHLDTSLKQLRNVLQSMDSGNYSLEELNQAAILTLNAMTYFQVKSAEKYVQQHEMKKARSALGYGMLHIQHALNHAEGSKKEDEIEIHAEMQAIIENHDLTRQEITTKLEQILVELEDLEVAYY